MAGPVMSLMSLFNRPAPAAPIPGGSQPNGQGMTPPGQSPQTSGTPVSGTQQSPQTANNGVVPNMANVGGTDTTPTPMAEFADIWQTPNTPDPNAVQPMFANLDPKKLQEAAARVNFGQAVTPELMAKIQAGGPAAQQAMMEAMNLMSQSVYSQAALATTKIVEQALTKQQENFDNRLPSMVKKLSVNDSLMADNPLYSNPAFQPVVEALQQQLIRKNPNATPSEIQQQIKDYTAMLGQQLNPAKAPADPAGTQDWSSFFESPSFG